MGMLLCLDREQRLAFVLGEILGATDAEGADALGTTRDGFRQRLSRARRQLQSFLSERCSLVDPLNPCRCARKTRAFVRAGIVDPARLQFTAAHRARVEEVAPRAPMPSIAPAPHSHGCGASTRPTSPPRSRSCAGCWTTRSSQARHESRALLSAPPQLVAACVPEPVDPSTASQSNLWRVISGCEPVGEHGSRLGSAPMDFTNASDLRTRSSSTSMTFRRGVSSPLPRSRVRLDSRLVLRDGVRQDGRGRARWHLPHVLPGAR